jgi:hypothetical protein
MRELAGAATLAVVTTACASGASGASGDEAIPVEPAVESTVETTTALES